MKKLLTYISALTALVLAFSCDRLEQENPNAIDNPAPTGKVMLNFKVAVPSDGMATKAMGNVPEINNMYVAVFGGSGFYNEWVQATIDNVSEANYDGTSATLYNVRVALTMSDSRLRLHFIANCPEKFRATPPITGISSQDLEEVVMGKVRSQITDEYNDAYWQKVILPNGVKARMEITEDEEGNQEEDYYTDDQGNYEASAATLAQFPNPIPLVRNFARIYLRNLTEDVTIQRYGLVFAPAEGSVAPILAEAYPSNMAGDYISNLDAYSGKVYYESFFRNYQNYPLESNDPAVTTIFDEPYLYEGYSPKNVKYGSYPDPDDEEKDPNYPTFEEMLPWDSSIDNNSGLQAPLFVYERGLPTAENRATRVLIYAHKDGEVDGSGNDLYKYYALDIVDDSNNYIPLLRNQTYTVKLISIESGSGETSIESAAGSSSATVSGDPATQYITEISDGSASISASYTEMLYVKPGTYDVFFRYIPTYVGDTAGQEDNSLVTFEVGTKNESTGVFTPVEAANASASVFKITGGEYAVGIEKDGDDVVLYARHGSGFSCDPDIVSAATEVWGRLYYTTVGDSTDQLIDEDDYFNVTRNGAIRITGEYNGHTIFRDVLVKISPRKAMRVECLQKYVKEQSGEREVVRVHIPGDLPRAVFPLQFKIEASAGSLTPFGDILPVETGASIVPNKTGPSYFFIKNLTRTEYEGLVASHPVTVGQATWTYFDCTFKTTVATSASVVYVQNTYFDDANDNDSFLNYTQRLFTNLGFQSTPCEDLPVEFIFSMDTAHPTSGGSTVWWDPDYNMESSLSTSNKVLPYTVLVTLEGLDPETNESNGELYTSFTSGSAYDPDPHDNIDYYLYHVGYSNTTPSAELANATLRLVASADAGGSTCRVGLSTLNITENPYLYAENSASATVSAVTITLNKSTTTIKVGNTETLTASVSPSSLSSSVVWSSSNTSVATVNGSGKVTAVARGTAVITASVGNKSASCTVTVKKSVKFNTTSSNLSTGNNKTLTSAADGITVTFSNINTVNAGYVRPGNRSTITIASSSNPFTEVIITFSANNYTYNFTVNTGSATLSGTTWTWTGSTTNLVATNTNNNTRRVTSIEILY